MEIKENDDRFRDFKIEWTPTTDLTFNSMIGILKQRCVPKSIWIKSEYGSKRSVLFNEDVIFKWVEVE